MKAPKNEQLSNGRTTNGRTRESSGNLNIFSRNRNPLVSRQVSSVGVSQNKWHDNQGEITPDLYVCVFILIRRWLQHSRSAKSVLFFWVASCHSFYVLIVSEGGEGGTPPNNRQKKSSSNDCSYCSFAAVCLPVPTRVGCQK